MVVYGTDTFNTIKCVPYSNCIYRLSKISDKFNRDNSEKEYEKCKKVCIVFNGLGNINEMLDYVLHFKGEPKKLRIKLLNINYT